MSNLDGAMDRELDGFLRTVAVTQLDCKYCGLQITFKDRVPYEENGREHRCLVQTARKYACYSCSATITFVDRKPVNADGSRHLCRRRPAAPAPAPSPTRIDMETGEIFPQEP